MNPDRICPQCGSENVRLGTSGEEMTCRSCGTRSLEQSCREAAAAARLDEERHAAEVQSYYDGGMGYVDLLSGGAL